MIDVIVNGEPRSIDAGTTVAGLVAACSRSTRGMAVAVNEEVVPRSTWGDVELGSDDRIELLTAAQGG